MEFGQQIPAWLRHVSKILNDLRMFPAQRFRLSGFRTGAGDDIPADYPNVKRWFAAMNSAPPSGAASRCCPSTSAKAR